MNKRKPKIKHELSIYFGIPGSGKTTYAAYLAKKISGVVVKFGRMFPSLGHTNLTLEMILASI